MSTPPDPPWRRRARIGGGLAVVAALGLVVSGAVSSALMTTVVVHADGAAVEVRTFGSLTAGAAVELAAVDVAPADEIMPAPQQEIADGDIVEVARAITVEVVLDGDVAATVTGVVGSVAGVLEEAGLAYLRDEGAAITPAWHAPVADGSTVTVTTPIPVAVEVDGEVIEIETLASHVGSALFDAGVELGEDDLIFPSEPTPLLWPTTVTIRRVDVDTEVEEVTLPFGEQRRERSDLPRGETRVEQEGEPGLRHDTYELTIIDGELTDRVLIDSEVVQEPVDQVVVVGTYVPPPPPPPTSTSSGSTVWDRLARCESGGNWRANTGNGYYGGLQFHPQTWRSVGGTGLPHEHSRETQIEMGKRLQARSGWGQWPSCARRLGLI